MKSYWIDNTNTNWNDYKNYIAKFGNQLLPDSVVLVATDDESRFSGFSAVSAEDEHLEILFFFVPEDNRRKGIGTYMLSEIANVARSSGLDIIRAIFPASSQLAGFFSAKGFDVLPGKKEYSVSIGALHYSRTFRKQIMEKPPKDIKTLEECSDTEKMQIKEYLNKNGILNEPPFNNKLSNILIGKDGIESIMLCDGLPDGIVIEYMYTEKGHPENLLNNLRKLNSILEEYGDKAMKLKLSFSTGNSDELNLLRLLAEETAEIEENTREYVALKNILFDGTITEDEAESEEKKEQGEPLNPAESEAEKDAEGSNEPAES